MKKYPFLALGLVLAAGCTPTLKTQNEVTIKPVQVTLDINLKVDQALTDALSNNKTANPSAPADKTATERRERMKARRPRLDGWKSEKLLGESNTGLLVLQVEPAKVNGEIMLTVTEENKDREEMFRTIAARQTSTPEVVGRRFAARIAERATPGTLRQTPEGEWITVEAK